MEVLSLLEVTVYLGIYDMVFFFQFKKKVSTASDYSSKNKIRRRGKEKNKNKEEHVARAFCQDTKIMKFWISSRHDPCLAKNYFQ